MAVERLPWLSLHTNTWWITSLATLGASISLRVSGVFSNPPPLSVNPSPVGAQITKDVEDEATIITVTLDGAVYPALKLCPGGP